MYWLYNLQIAYILPRILNFLFRHCDAFLYYFVKVWKIMLSQFLLLEVDHTGLSSAEDNAAVHTNGSAFMQ